MRDEVLEVRFGGYMVAEVHQKFWEAMTRGEFITDAAQGAGSYRKQGARWLVACGGVRPRRGRNLKGRCLTFAEREEIALLRSQRQGVRQIAAAVGRSPSTISRELRRNAERRGGYRASTAHAAAYDAAFAGLPVTTPWQHPDADSAWHLYVIRIDVPMTFSIATGTANFENLSGSGFGDSLTGDDGPNLIWGGHGDDNRLTERMFGEWVGPDDNVLVPAAPGQIGRAHV